jgi:large subunit ribosomal protein L15
VRLHELKNVKGAVHRRKRVGTGEGGGRGKTSGRGGKGQTARSGKGIRIGFEGGQMPIYRRLPMRGFTNIFKKRFTAVNVGELEKVAGDVVNRETLIAAGLLRSNVEFFKVLGTGEATRAFKVSAHGVSEVAKAKIEKAGGAVTLIEIAPKAEAGEK